MVREVMAIHIGQAGIQAGQAFWELMCAEHGVAPDGGHQSNCSPCPDEYMPAFFEPTAMQTVSPRCFCIDTEPTAIDSLNTGGYRDFYNPAYMLAGPEDAGGCFARGFIHYGRRFCSNAKDKIRQVVEACDQFQGFMIFRSLTGGTGSGLASVLQRKLHDDYFKKNLLGLEILPTSCPGEAVDPYNVCLGLHHGMDCSDVSFLFENEAMFSVARSQMELRTPNFRHVNQLIATVASHITTGLRFRYQNLRCSSSDEGPHLMKSVSSAAVSTMVNGLFSPQCQMVKCDTGAGRFISATLLLRGDFQPNEVNQHIYRLANQGPRSSLRFVDWAPAGMKYSLCNRVPIRAMNSDLGQVPRSVVGALNNTSMKDVMGRIVKKFKKMYAKRAFLHHYLQEGMDEAWFDDAKEDMVALGQDFNILLSNSNVKVEKKEIELEMVGKSIRRSASPQIGSKSKPKQKPIKH